MNGEGRRATIRRRIGSLSAAVLLFVATTSRAFAADTKPPILVEAPSSAQLAQQSLAALERGEAALTRERRLDAYREGLALAKRAVALDDDSADAHFGVFANQARIMDLEGVATNPFNLLVIKRELNRTLELNPNHVDALVARGAMLRRLPRLLGGDLVEAESYLRKALSIDARAISPRVELAEVYLDRREIDQARRVLEEAASLADHDGKPQRLAEIRTRLSELSANR